MTLNRMLSAIVFLLVSLPLAALGADKLTGIHSARVMSQSLPWVAEEAGLFKKHNLDFQLVFISSSSIVTAALLGADAEMTLTGGIGNVIAYVRGSTDVVFVGGVKNMLTHSIVGGANIKKPEDLKSKRIGVAALAAMRIILPSRRSGGLIVWKRGGILPLFKPEENRKPLPPWRAAESTRRW